MQRKLLQPLAAIALAALAAVATPGSLALAAADHHHHAEGSTTAHTLHLNAGRKWATDAPLRQSMDGINQAMRTALPLIHQGRFSDADYTALATTLNQKVAHAIEHCKLDPKADAMLHLVIAELLAGAEIMEGKTAAPRHDGAVRVKQALAAYAKHFQHPNWKAPRG